MSNNISIYSNEHLNRKISVLFSFQILSTDGYLIKLPVGSLYFVICGTQLPWSILNP